MLKKRYILPLTAAVVLLSGCGGSGEKKESAPQTAGNAPQIKVTKGAVDTAVKEGPSKSNSGQFYYSYNKEKNETQEAPKTRTTIDAYLNIKSPYERVRITMMIKRLSNDYIIRCSPCHDDYANGVIGPSLLDKNATFIYQRIIAFKTGEKKNVLMKELVSQIDDDKLKAIAEEIANFNKEIRKMRRGK
jgi:cytochrome c553